MQRVEEWAERRGVCIVWRKCAVCGGGVKREASGGSAKAEESLGSERVRRKWAVRWE